MNFQDFGRLKCCIVSLKEGSEKILGIGSTKWLQFIVIVYRVKNEER